MLCQYRQRRLTQLEQLFLNTTWSSGRYMFLLSQMYARAVLPGGVTLCMNCQSLDLPAPQLARLHRLILQLACLFILEANNANTIVSHFIHKSAHVCHRLSSARHRSLRANFLAEEVALADVSAYHGRLQSWTSARKLGGEL